MNVPCFHATMDAIDALRERDDEDHDDSYRDDADYVTLSDRLNEVGID